jgi:hypothetical protein
MREMMKTTGEDELELEEEGAAALAEPGYRSGNAIMTRKQKQTIAIASCLQWQICNWKSRQRQRESERCQYGA